MTEDEMVGGHHRLHGHEFEQTLGDSEGQGSLACCSPWGCRVRYDLATEQQQHVKFRGVVWWFCCVHWRSEPLPFCYNTLGFYFSTF